MKKFLGVFVFLCALIALSLLVLLRSGLFDSVPGDRFPVPAAASAAPLSPADTSTTPVHMTPDPTAEPSAEPTPEPTPEAEPESFILSFIGDLTLTSHQYSSDYETKMNGDYSYPFSNTVQYFADDEYTIANLECTLSDQWLSSIQTFYFRAPTAAANILIEGGVDFVTTANNHADDFNKAGKLDTWAALEEYGIDFGKNDEAKIVTTPNGLRLGIYCQYNNAYGDYRPDEDKAVAGIRALKEQDPDLIICAFHMGVELQYHPEVTTPETARICRRCIDEGADIIYGCHPHCLQPIEEYNDGLIMYSVGEFTFGGHTFPTDQDTAIVQVSVERRADGKISVAGYSIIPCCVSSRPVYEEAYKLGVRGKNQDYNDYRPTPYEEGTEDYYRALAKITGTYDGPDGQANYGSWHEQHQ